MSDMKQKLEIIKGLVGCVKSLEVIGDKFASFGNHIATSELLTSDLMGIQNKGFTHINAMRDAMLNMIESLLQEVIDNDRSKEV